MATDLLSSTNNILLGIWVLAQFSDTLRELSVHSASPVLLTSSGPLGVTLCSNSFTESSLARSDNHTKDLLVSLIPSCFWMQPESISVLIYSLRIGRDGQSQSQIKYCDLSNIALPSTITLLSSFKHCELLLS